MKKCAVIYNPESGKEATKKGISDIPSILETNGYKAIMCPTKGPKDATKIVKRLPVSTNLVICVGGDGTLNEGITGNMKRLKKLKMSLLPVGTVNDVGSMYGYTKNIIKDTEMLLDGVTKNIDVCMINRRPYIYVACLGSYVDVSYNTPRDLKKRYGRLGYIFNALNELKDKIKLFDLTYIVNGKKVSGTYSFIFVTNTYRLGGFDNIYNDVKLDDNMFEVILCTAKTKPELLVIAGKILTGQVKNMPGVEYYKTNDFKIIFDSVPPSWVIDGEEYKHNARKFHFTLKKMKMLVPKRNVSKLFVERGVKDNESL